MRNTLLFVQFFLALLCCWWLWESIHWSEVLPHWDSVSLGVVCVIFLQRFTPWILLGCRLSSLFSRQITRHEGFIASALCVGTNAIIPARMGEVVKIFWLRGYKPFSYSMLLSRCFMERLLDVSMLMLLSLGFVLQYIQPMLALAGILILCCIWISCYIFMRYGQHIQSRFPFLCRPPWHEILETIQASFTYMTSYKILATLSLWTVGIWVLNYIHIALICNWLVQLGLNWQEIGVITICVFFSSAFLLIPGGIGVMEATLVVVLQTMHVEIQQAALVAIFVRFFHLVPSVIVGVLALFHNAPQKRSLQLFLLQNKKNRFSLSSLHKTFTR